MQRQSTLMSWLLLMLDNDLHSSEEQRLPRLLDAPSCNHESFLAHLPHLLKEARSALADGLRESRASTPPWAVSLPVDGAHKIQERRLRLCTSLQLRLGHDFMLHERGWSGFVSVAEAERHGDSVVPLGGDTLSPQISPCTLKISFVAGW
jgi:hypothetical protein